MNRPKAIYYRTVDVPQLDRMIELGGKEMQKAARAEKRRRKEATPPRQGSLAFNGNGNGSKGAATTARERAIRDWLK